MRGTPQPGGLLQGWPNLGEEAADGAQTEDDCWPDAADGLQKAKAVRKVRAPPLVMARVVFVFCKVRVAKLASRRAQQAVLGVHPEGRLCLLGSGASSNHARAHLCCDAQPAGSGANHKHPLVGDRLALGHARRQHGSQNRDARALDAWSSRKTLS